MMVVSQVPFSHRFVQSIKPIGSCRHQGHHFYRNIRRHKPVYRMADKHIREFDPLPEEFPDLFLRTSRLRNQIAPNFNMRTIYDFDLGPMCSDQRDKTWHLRVVDNNNISTAGCKRTPWRKPVSLSIEEDPVFELVLLKLVETFIWMSNTLKDVVVCFCNAED
jgi:hypothetical protein